MLKTMLNVEHAHAEKVRVRLLNLGFHEVPSDQRDRVKANEFCVVDHGVHSTNAGLYFDITIETKAGSDNSEKLMLDLKGLQQEAKNT